jgi:hypothetical protein
MPTAHDTTRALASGQILGTVRPAMEAPNVRVVTGKRDVAVPDLSERVARLLKVLLNQRTVGLAVLRRADQCRDRAAASCGPSQRLAALAGQLYRRRLLVEERGRRSVSNDRPRHPGLRGSKEAEGCGSVALDRHSTKISVSGDDHGRPRGRTRPRLRVQPFFAFHNLASAFGRPHTAGRCKMIGRPRCAAATVSSWG